VAPRKPKIRRTCRRDFEVNEGSIVTALTLKKRRVGEIGGNHEYI